ncbi:1-(5-phosphoribosyl)-5-[(5-phosphoribosylamino)methylideneamino]imidazole-4-carboxamide isomerase [Deinococcus radiophilus]|uniref:1-(5-phosphoribosyl)-5-[(5-phosphoribosylamino)methylideneamino] imidazole-4-carboxamide isomerase n=1 Tax=Deinococcus radiophilus TaxID=32062 RepID=A0A431VQ31_9DEIO|nr:1-(5-phosphoribosyl)-5-[(5-phosphoribosylamino)methylideneamino] imidazole-4-carboxamide isomerase [Deinococcus radiophilus]RTR25285.1 1-(5-phosphoribosyl)-5-[(5-phosphoribosylamino)methylideneamino] imidazole-4-carboxamide isomerase [Deinococcus radiophilus]UFA51457.1 1-(5-phosphoribosyl)-5-[(5-phosphoribosylamino)methylideneamino] imidazole-4-carboxamide isomerase [Deinococcus radiophilus]
MLIPALDLIGGEVVRLYQGDFAQKTVYAPDPLPLALAYQAAGAGLLHLVDLDGARAPARRQLALLTRLSRELTLPLQVGGGLRTTEDIKGLLGSGVSRAVVGSAAIADPAQAAAWLREFGPERLTLALDLRLEADGRRTLLTHGWQAGSERSLDDFLAELRRQGVTPRHILCTDISKDGTLSGPNTALYTALVREYPALQWQASGGVSSLNDIAALRAAGVAGVILGKSLLTGQFTLAQAQQVWQGEDT